MRLLQELLQERERRRTAGRRFHVFDVVAQQLPPFRVPGARIDVDQLAIDGVESGERRQLVAGPGDSEVRARRDQGIDLGRGEVVQQIRYEVIDTVPAQSLVGDQRLVVG